MDINTSNSQFVGAQGDDIVVLSPARRMTRDEALRHAAWIVAIAEPFAETSFADVLEAVRST